MKKWNKKVFLKTMFDVLKDSDFMESVMVELLEFYRDNTDEQNELEFDESMLPEMLEKSIEMEWYEEAARIHKQLNKNKTNVEAG
jgi:hypothetical protein